MPSELSPLQAPSLTAVIMINTDNYLNLEPDI